MLPVPLRGHGSGREFDDLGDILGLSPQGEQFHLLTGWAVSTFIPGIAHPILMRRGEQGSGKSTAARALISLVDPSTAALRATPRLQDWASVVKQSGVIGLDNVSRVSDDLANLLCTAVTGDAHVVRQLYTDDTNVISAFRRNIVITSIGLDRIRGDLGDRLLVLEMPSIAPGRRLSERDLNDQLECQRSRLFGALLDLLAGVLAELPTVGDVIDDRPRMADFYEVLVALDRSIGGYTSYASDYRALITRTQSAVVQDDTFVAAVRAFVLGAGCRTSSGGHYWSGTMTDLLKRITPTPSPPDWPRQASSAGLRLTNAEPALRGTGLFIRRSAQGDRRTLE